MGWRSRRAGKQALACLAVLAVGGLAGLLAGFGADPTDTSELSPAEIVAMRFEGANARDNAAAEPAGFVLASADSQEFAGLLFNPNPVYPPQAQSPPASAASAAAPATRVLPTRPVAPPPADLSLPPQLANVEPELPAEALAYAADDLPLRAAPAPAPVKKAVPHPASASNAVLNSAQIASIKERLKLTSYQSTLWPPVESALRDISYQGGHDVSHKTAGVAAAGVVAHGGTIDPNSAPVQRLKSVAFPLLMSLNGEQKQEVRTMVRLMGLESLASQF
jgi:hypothetical protein